MLEAGNRTCGPISFSEYPSAFQYQMQPLKNQENGLKVTILPKEREIHLVLGFCGFTLWALRILWSVPWRILSAATEDGFVYSNPSWDPHKWAQGETPASARQQIKAHVSNTRRLLGSDAPCPVPMKAEGPDIQRLLGGDGWGDEGQHSSASPAPSIPQPNQACVLVIRMFAVTSMGHDNAYSSNM